MFFFILGVPSWWKIWLPNCPKLGFPPRYFYVGNLEDIFEVRELQARSLCRLCLDMLSFLDVLFKQEHIGTCELLTASVKLLCLVWLPGQLSCFRIISSHPRKNSLFKTWNPFTNHQPNKQPAKNTTFPKNHILFGKAFSWKQPKTSPGVAQTSRSGTDNAPRDL